MIPVDRCPACGGEGKFDVANFDRELNIEIRMYSCARCNTVYHNPRMSEADMIEYYNSGKYRSLTTRTITEATAVARAKTTIEMIYASMRKTPGRCLDVGCSRGYLLRALNEKFGAEVVGYDVFKDPQAVVDVVSNKDGITGKFDLITCIHVLEHFYDPMAELTWMVNLLADDGMLMIEIPLVRVITVPHPVIFGREAVPWLMRHINCNYIFIDMQITGIGIIMAWKKGEE